MLLRSQPSQQQQLQTGGGGARPELDVYCDGSCPGNGSREAATSEGGIGVYFGANDQRNLSLRPQIPSSLFPKEAGKGKGLPLARCTGGAMEVAACSFAIRKCVTAAREERRAARAAGGGRRGVPPHDDAGLYIRLYTDSEFAIRAAEERDPKSLQSMQPVERHFVQDLYRTLDKMSGLAVTVKFIHVPAHAPPPATGAHLTPTAHWVGNRAADALAKEASSKRASASAAPPPPRSSPAARAPPPGTDRKNRKRRGSPSRKK